MGIEFFLKSFKEELVLNRRKCKKETFKLKKKNFNWPLSKSKGVWVYLIKFCLFYGYSQQNIDWTLIL